MTGDLSAALDGAALIAAERQRQVEQEGWTPEHDASHHEGELARAAACYALAASAPQFARRLDASDEEHGAWPLRWEFKSADPVRMLVKAGALIAAEIDRLAPAPEAPGEAANEDHHPGTSLTPTPDCGGPRKPPGATEVWWCEDHREFHGAPPSPAQPGEGQ